MRFVVCTSWRHVGVIRWSQAASGMSNALVLHDDAYRVLYDEHWWVNTNQADRQSRRAAARRRAGSDCACIHDIHDWKSSLR